MELQLEGVYYVVRAEAISRQLPVVRESSERDTVEYSPVPGADLLWTVLREGRTTSAESATVILEDSRLCAIKGEIVLYLLCVISAIVAINSLVESRESTLLLSRCLVKHVTILNWIWKK
jgi:hypothetical protein